MCIRDRLVIAQNTVGSDVAADYILNRGITIRGTSAALVTPVSYTHLRAHETVLDLVCRLLLEKKKDTTQLPV